MTVSDVLKRENNNLDLVRIILATMVVWSHAFQMNFGGFEQEPMFKFLKVSSPGTLAVSAFFFVSGLLVTNSLIKKKSISKFYISRFFRLFPALAILLLITVFVIGPIISTLPITEYFSNPQTWKYLFNNLYLNVNYQIPGCFQNNIWPVDVNSSLWSLPFEVGCYIFLLAVFTIISGHKKIANIVLISIIFISIIPNQMLLIFFERSYILGLQPIACFAFGAFLAINQDDIKVDFKMMLGFTLLLLIFWRFTTIIQILFPFAISILLLLFSTDKFVLKLKPKYDISYGLYIWNALIIQLIVYYFGNMNVYILFLIAFIITSIVSLGSFILIEKGSINMGYSLGAKVSKSNFNFERISISFLILLFIILLSKLL